MTSGGCVSARERESAREQAALLGRVRVAGPRERAGVVQWAVRLGRAEGGKEKSARFDFVFLFQNCE
jgi:hypothetical protein